MRSKPSAKPKSAKPSKADRVEAQRAAYETGVFINCPFDDSYKPLFDATVFAVLDCGFDPRCAKQVYDSGRVRIDKIMKLIEGCRYGVHDISRTELDTATSLPRFNMPLELGIFLGAQRFGTGRQKQKNCLVLDREDYRYQMFISDIAGQDISSHGGQVEKLVKTVRNWLSTAAGGAALPGGAAIASRFQAFSADLPVTVAKVHLGVDELTFSNYVNFASEWLRDNLIDAAPTT